MKRTVQMASAGTPKAGTKKAFKPRKSSLNFRTVQILDGKTLIGLRAQSPISLRSLVLVGGIRKVGSSKTVSPPRRQGEPVYGKKYRHGQDRCVVSNTQNGATVLTSTHGRMNYEASKYFPNDCQKAGKR